MNLRAVLIDLDNTLIDSLPALFQVYQRFLTHHGKKGTKEEFDKLIGPSIEEIAEKLRVQYNLPGTSKELSNLYVTMIMLQGFQGTELFPGARFFLEEAKRRKMALGLVTSGTKPLVKQCLDPLGITDLFDVVVTAEDVKRAKPDPELYRVALTLLQVAPQEVVVIEDASAGVKAAREAGIEKIAVITHGRPVPVMPGEKTFHYWKEISEWLFGISEKI